MVQSLKNWLQRALVALSLATLFALTPAAVHADNYGSGNYNSGVYGSNSSSSGGSSSGGSSSSGSTSSPSSSSGSSGATSSSSPTQESTVVKTESGLEVAINLADGQAIPSTGYYITITPLNGQGKTFDKAEIYLDGVLAYSGAPDSTGTLKWLWDASKSPATKVKVIVYGPGSGTTTHEFNVTVSPVQATTNNPQNTNTPATTPETSSAWPAWAFWLIGLVVLALVIILVVIIRRRRQSQQLPPPMMPM